MARTVIDALVVTLGLDASGFTKGAAAATASLNQTSLVAGRTATDLQAKGKTAAEFFSRVRVGSVELAKRQTATGIALRSTAQIAGRTALEMQSKGNVAGEFFSRIKNQALGLMTVLLGGKSILGMVSQTTTALASLGKAAQNASMPVEDLAAFRNVVEANGDSADAAAASFRDLARSQQEYKETGKAANIAGLIRVGATGEDTASQVMQKFAAMADKHQNDRQYIQRIGEQLGLDQGLINIGARGTGSLNKALADARTRGVPDKGMTDRALALYAAYVKTKQAVGFLTDVLVDKFAPALTRILDTITAFIIASPDAATGIGAAATLLAGFAAPAIIKGVARSVLGTGPAIAEGEGGVVAAAMLFGRTLISLFTRWFPWLGIAAIALAPTPTGGAEDDKRVHDEGNARRVARGGKTSEQEYQDSLSVRDQARDFFRGKGLSEEQTAGVLANIKAESNFDPQAEDGTGAHGLFQHQGSRWRDLQADAGTNKPNTQQQLEFAWKEMNGGGVNGIIAALRATNTAEDAARVVTKQFERPANPELRGNQRAMMARDQLSQNMRGVQQERAATPLAANQNTTNSSTSTVAINGPITIHTQATDARGIAGSLRDELKSRGFIAQANRGLA